MGSLREIATSLCLPALVCLLAVPSVLATEGRVHDCPPGTRMAGATPADATARGCQRQDKEGNLIRHGPWTEWYLNGQKQKQGDYFNGKRTGLWTWWYPGGLKMQQGKYLNDLPVGVWSYWDEQGKPVDIRKSQRSGSLRKAGSDEPSVDREDFGNTLKKAFGR
ncbi:MAG: hypothetical protein AB1540_02870 [Bdellovibrionota bacterium]